MRKREWFASVFRFLRPVVLIDLGIFAFVGLVCWFGGWRTAHHYGNGLMLAGVAAVLIGISSLLGGWGLTRSVDYQYARSVGEDSIGERTKRDLKDVARSYGFLIRMTVVGVVSYAFGLVIQTVFG